jgi:hypothetical protein
LVADDFLCEASVKNSGVWLRTFMVRADGDAPLFATGLSWRAQAPVHPYGDDAKSHPDLLFRETATQCLAFRP